MGSSIVAVKDGLLALLVADEDMAGVQVSYGDTGDTARRERVWLGDVEEAIHEPAVLKAGRRRREETYQITAHVEVVGKPSPQANEARALALAHAIEDTLADDPTVGGTVPVGGWAIVNRLMMETGDTTDGVLTHVEVNILVKGRLL